MIVSIDQNSNSLWDTLPKLHALAAHGYATTHCIEDIDVAFTALGAEVDTPNLRIVPEQFHASGGQDWGAALFYSEFLGRLPLELRTLTPQLDTKISTLAKQLDRPLQELYDQYAVSDNWMLIGSSFVGDANHHRLIGDLTTAETTEFVTELLDRAEHDCLHCFPANDARQRTEQWFRLERRRVEEILDTRKEGRLIDVYHDWLQLHLGRAIPMQTDQAAGPIDLTLTGRAMNLSANPAGLELLSYFTRNYDQAAELYNKAVNETNLGLHPLRVKDRELPFYAVLQYQHRLVRCETSLGYGAIHIAGQEVPLLPDGRLDTNALAKAGITALAGKAIVLVIQARLGQAGGSLALPHHGSLYMPAAHRLAALLESADALPAKLHPILRVRLRFLDRLADVDTTLILPDHLKAEFETDEISTRDFAHQWRLVAEAARKRLEQFKSAKFRQTWLDSELSTDRDELVQLEARKRQIAAIDPKAEELRPLWKRIKTIQTNRTAALLRRVVWDAQAADLDFYDSRGAILPWAVAAGGIKFYHHVIRQAEITEETH